MAPLAPWKIVANALHFLVLGDVDKQLSYIADAVTVGEQVGQDVVARDGKAAYRDYLLSVPWKEPFAGLGGTGSHPPTVPQPRMSRRAHEELTWGLMMLRLRDRRPVVPRFPFVEEDEERFETVEEFVDALFGVDTCSLIRAIEFPGAPPKVWCYPALEPMDDETARLTGHWELARAEVGAHGRVMLASMHPPLSPEAAAELEAQTAKVQQAYTQAMTALLRHRLATQHQSSSDSRDDG